jgi:hypothetical protein
MRFPRTTRRAMSAAMAAGLMLFALGGCGAGVVGTGGGSGDDGDDDIQYTPVGLCTADFAPDELACRTDIKDPDRGTAPVQWADANKAGAGATVLARLELNGMGLQVPCLNASFLGNWGELPDGTRGFIGRYVSADLFSGQPAIVYVLEAPNEPDAVGWLQIVDGQGGKLAGPWLVRRVEGAVEFAACPP